jgi:hypothetical protein
MFPQRIQSIYDAPLGSDAVLEDYMVEDIEINPNFPTAYFAGLPENSSETRKTAPSSSPQYPSGEGFSKICSGVLGLY